MEVLKKSLAVGLAGVTAFSSIPLNALADNDTVGIEDSNVSSEFESISLNIGGVDTVLGLSEGSYYYSEDRNKLVFSKGTVFNLTVTNDENVSVSVDYNEVSSYDVNKFSLSGLRSDSIITINFSDGSSVQLNLLDYFRVLYPFVESFVFVESNPSILDINTGSSDCSNGYFYGDILEYVVHFSKDSNLSLGEYDIVTLFNGVTVPDSCYEVSEENETVTIRIPLNEERYGVVNKDGAYEFSVMICDGFGGSSSSSSTVNIDRKSPVASIEDISYVVGTDGGVYCGTNGEGSVEFYLDASDNASGVGGVSVSSESGNALVSYEGGRYRIVIPNDGSGVATPVFTVVDNCGNSSSYRISELLGVDSDSIIFGIPKANFNVSVLEGEEVLDWYKGNVVLNVEITNEIAGVKDVKYIVNGEEIGSFPAYDEGVSGAFINTLDLDENVNENGIADVKIISYDANGNESVYTNSYKIDNVSPSIDDIDVSDKQKYFIFGNTAYLNGGVNISGSPSDRESGVAYVEILLDGEVIGNSLPFSDGRSGSYSVRVTDKVGNYSEFSLSNIVGRDFDKVFVSRSYPAIDVEAFSGDVVYIDGVAWYSSLDSLNFSVESDNLRDVTVLANSSELSYVTEDGKNYTVSLEGLEDGLYTIDISANAKNGNESKKTIKFGVDSTRPVISSGEIDGVYSSLESDVVFKGNLSLKVSIEENHSGIDKVQLLNGEDVVSENTTGEFSITESGEYFIRVVDKIGNESKVSVKDLLGLSSNSLVADNEAPSIDFIIPDGGLGDSGNIFGENITCNINITDDNGLTNTKILCNGEVVYESENGVTTSYDLNTGAIRQGENGLYSIEITSEDIVGNISTESYSVYIDTKSPDIEEVRLTKDYEDRGGFLWFKETPKLVINATDNLVEVEKYYVLNKDGSETESSVGLVSLKDGDYAIRVEDSFGNLSPIIEIKELIGSENSIVSIDEGKPVINCSRPDGDLDGWYNTDVEYVAKLSDDKGIYKASININGTEVASFSSDGDEVLNKVLKASTANAVSGASGVYNVVVEVEDYSGKISTWSDTINVDKDAPVIEEAVISSGVNKNYGVFYKGNPTLTVKANDGDGVGLKDYILIDKDGNEVSSADGKFSVFTGEYYLVVSDKLGNKSSKVSLKDLLGLSSNYIVVDSDSPVIECSRPDGDLDNWFANDVEYVANVSDNQGLLSAKMYINGVEVDSFTEEGNGFTDKTLRANTDLVSPSGYGTYTVLVEAVDNSGNSASWSDTIYVDKEKPIFTNAMISSDYESRGYGVYFKSNPIISVSGIDEGIGVKDYTLLDKDGNVVSRNSTGEFELQSGEYLVRVSDRLGYYDTKSLKALLGLSSNKIVVDGEKPVIDCSRPSGDVNGWFSDDVEYSVDLSDNVGLYSAEVTINGEVVDSFIASSGDVSSKLLKANTSKVEPKSDGSYEIIVNTTDNSGNSNSWRDVIYIDRVAPSIEKFSILAEGYKEGNTINGDDKYGFYLKDASKVEIYVSDGDISSGMNKVYYSLINASGGVTAGTVDIVNGVGTVEIPQNFKGFISAYASDMVGNIGKTNKPDGVVSEDGNVHVNTSSINMTLPETVYKDNKGYNLYNSGISISTDIRDTTSGIRSIEWGINDETRGVVTIDNDGNIDGDVASVGTRDKNLVISLNKILGVENNENSLNVWVRTIDRAGHVSESSRVVSIDTDKPVIEVAYGETIGSGYYDSNRVATVKITERNFNPSDVKFSGTYGTVGSWRNVEGNTWVAEVVFSDDGEYQWGVDYTDMAGNKGMGYSSEKFTIDKTAPVFDVTYSNNSSENGNFYKEGRTATVSIIEKNFNENLVKLEGDGVISGWSHSGDKHTANIVFNDDGKYKFSLSTSDLAGNTSSVYDSGEFVIDKTAPKLKVSGVQNGVSYKKGASFRVTFSDEYIDASRCTAKLVGRANGSIELSASIDSKTGEFVFEGLPEELKYDDLYKLEVTIYDKAGNISKEELSFSINRFGSQYNFLDELILGNIINAPVDVTLEETSVDRLDINSCRIVVIRDGNIISVDDKYLSIEESGGIDGPWVYKYFIDKRAFDEDGKYQIQIFSKSLDGTDNSSLVQEYAFLLDTEDPEIIVSGVEDGEFYKDVSKKVTIDVRDLSGVESIDALLNGDHASISEEDGIYYLTIGESNKRQSLEVTVVDKAGNEATVRVDDFLITSSILQSLIHSTIFKVSAGVMSALVAGLLLLILRRRKKNKDEELQKAKETAKLYEESVTGSSSNEDK